MSNPFIPIDYPNPIAPTRRRNRAYLDTTWIPSPLSTTFTLYAYVLVATAGSNHSAGSNPTTILNIPVLNATNFNDIEPNGGFGTNATSLSVYRTMGGTTQGLIGTIPLVNSVPTTGNGSGLSGSTVPAGPTITSVSGFSGPGQNLPQYAIVAYYGPTSHSAAGSTTSLQVNAWDGVSTIQLQWGWDGLATAYWIYRVSGGTIGVIGTQGISSAPQTFIDSGQAASPTGYPPAQHSGLITPAYGGTSVYTFTDGGLVGDGSTPPTTATPTAASVTRAILDMITDGTYIYIAVVDDIFSDPIIYGRILIFSPVTSTWTQSFIPAFPTTDGSGTAGSLTEFDGALVYGTYNGTSAGNTAYVTSHNTEFPLPAGGVPEVHTLATSLAPSCLAVFLGELYVGTVAQSAQAAVILKRVPIATWSTAFTAPASTTWNAFTSMYVWNGRLYAGWCDGTGNTASIIYSTADGVTWTQELVANINTLPSQMVAFNNNLYVAFASTGTSTSIARDATSYFNYGAGPVSWSHTAASGSCLWVGVRDDAGLCSGATYAGSSMTLLQSVTTAGGAHYYQFYIDNIGNAGGPSAGTQTITIQGTTTGGAVAESFSGFTGHLTLDAFGTKAAHLQSTIAQSITTITDNCWYNVILADRSGTLPTANAGFTVEVAPSVSSISMDMGDNGVTHPPSTINVVGNVSAASDSVIMVAAFSAAAAGLNYIYQRTPTGTWTKVDNAPTGGLSGALGITYF